MLTKNKIRHSAIIPRIRNFLGPYYSILGPNRLSETASKRRTIISKVPRKTAEKP